MQNVAMTAIYAALFIITMRSDDRNPFAILAVSSLFSALFNLGYGTFAEYRVATSIALVIRLCVPMDALMKTLGQRRLDRIALVLLGGSLALGACTPGSRAWGYLEVRTVLTGSVALVCIMACIEHARKPFPVRTAYIRHLHLQAAWTSIHTIISATSPWCLHSWTPWLVLRWTFIACSLAVLHGYIKLFTRNREVPVEASAYRSREQLEQ